MSTFLQVFNKVPVNSTTLLLDQYLKCSIPGFREHFSILMSVNHPDLETVSSILIQGQNTKRQLKSEGCWNPTKKQGAVFLGTSKDKPDDKAPKQKTDKTGKDKKPMHNCNGNPIDCHPLKNGEAHKRTNSLTGKEEHWCGNPKCQHWGSHETQKHTEWFEKLREKCKLGKDKNGGKPATMKETTSPFLQIPHANFVESIGEGFSSPF